MLHSVITTIQRPTQSVRGLAARLAGNRGHLVVAGDSKGPDTFDLFDVPGFEQDQLTFLSLDAQCATDFGLAGLLPTKHYSRKNVAYLQAMHNGASCIYETDDDNAPLDSWQPRGEHAIAASILKSTAAADCNWINVYRHFSSHNIWPRGLPLDRIHLPFATTSDYVPITNENGEFWAPIQQGLVNGSPDVDAVWRLVLDREFTFEMRESVLLPPGQWCPFNTQSTWWWPSVYALLYVPSFCSFRMCDIWKSFVAQRCLWELGTGIVFHPPEVWQERNEHNLLHDFDDEIPGYQQNHTIAITLQNTSLLSGPEHVGDNLRLCYLALIDEKIFPASELELVDAWIADLPAIVSVSSSRAATAAE